LLYRTMALVHMENNFFQPSQHLPTVYFPVFTTVFPAAGSCFRGISHREMWISNIFWMRIKNIFTQSHSLKRTVYSYFLA